MSSFKDLEKPKNGLGEPQYRHIAFSLKASSAFFNPNCSLFPSYSTLYSLISNIHVNLFNCFMTGYFVYQPDSSFCKALLVSYMSINSTQPGLGIRYTLNDTESSQPILTTVKWVAWKERKKSGILAANQLDLLRRNGPGPSPWYQTQTSWEVKGSREISQVWKGIVWLEWKQGKQIGNL